MSAGWERRHYSKGKRCVDCETPVTNTSTGRCKPCHGRSMRPAVGRAYMDSNGYMSRPSNPNA